jgi:diguanylate cyclase (GGDEF)-like protein
MDQQQLASTATLRLTELYSHDIFCTPLEARFDRLTRLARASLGVPVVTITVRAGDRLWFKSVIGWDVREVAVADSLSERTLASTEAIVIEDTLREPGFAEHPLVAKHPKFRFYAGQSLADHRGLAVGTFDLYDLRPHVFKKSDLQTLHDLVQLARKELLTTDIGDAQAQLVKKLSSARREALMDPLTATWNRRAADDLLKTAMETADRENVALAVCVVDVNKFKQINDTYGHPVGDLALRKVARSLVSSVRDGDVVCRTGGDEFLIVMPRVGPNEADTVAARIRRNISETPLRMRDSGKTIPLSISTGTAIRRPGEHTAAKDLIEAADHALYRAKEVRSTAEDFAHQY